MKTNFVSTILTLLSGVVLYGQGVFIDDQFSTTTAPSTTPGFGSSIQAAQPGGQSFTPSLNAVGFIRLNLGDGNPNNGLGATVYVVLHSDSITGSILGTSSSVVMPDNYAGAPDFIFATPVTVTPGVTYYFQPIVQLGGDVWGSASGGYGYSGGSAWFQGNASAGDLWFHEGIIVPEPSSALLLLLSSGFLFFVRRKHRT